MFPAVALPATLIWRVMTIGTRNDDHARPRSSRVWGFRRGARPPWVLRPRPFGRSAEEAAAVGPAAGGLPGRTCRAPRPGEPAPRPPIRPPIPAPAMQRTRGLTPEEDTAAVASGRAARLRRSDHGVRCRRRSRPVRVPRPAGRHRQQGVEPRRGPHHAASPAGHRPLHRVNPALAGRGEPAGRQPRRRLGRRVLGHPNAHYGKPPSWST